MEMRKKKLKNMSRNRDNYSWTELDCLTKPISLAIRYYGIEYQNLYLYFETANRIFKVFDRQRLEEVEESYGIKKTVMTRLCENMYHETIIENINKDIPVVAVTDGAKIYYDGNYYRRQSHMHPIPITGYDFERDYYTVLDNLHNVDDRAIYNHDVIPFHMLYSFSIDGTIITYIKEKESIDYSKIKDIMIEIAAYVINKYKGWNQEEIREETIEAFINYFDKRRVYYDYLLEILKILIQSEAIMNESSLKVHNLMERYSDTKAYIIRKILKKENAHAQYIEYLKEEKSFHTYLKTILEKKNRDPKSDVKKSKVVDQYEMVNMKDIQYYFNNNEVRIIHTDKEENNLWEGINEAPQILFPVDETKELTLETRVYVVLKQEDSVKDYQSGIIIKLKNEETILFGLLRGECISLINPYQNFEKKIVYINNEVDLRVEVKKQRIDYYYKIDDEWMKFYSKAENIDVKAIGIYSRTWSPCNHNVVFKNTRLKMEEEKL